MNRLDGAPTLPIKDETDIALEALARQMYADYDVSEEEAMQMARAQLMKTMDATGYPTPEASGNDAAARLAEQHMAAGASPERAQRLGEGYTRIHGPQEAWARVQRNNTPDGKAFLENANREMDADDARHQKMYDDYFTATNAPSHQKVSPETQRQWEDTGRYAREQGRIIRAGLHPQTPVDPIDPDATYSSDEEAAQKKADRDAQMEGVFKNIRQRYGESEEANARAAYAAGDTYVPQTAQQASRNENYRNDQYAAMKDDGEARDRLRGVDDRRQPYVRARQLRELGLPDDAPGFEISDSRIRQMLAEKRASDKASKDMLWKQRAMIRGGNAIGAMSLPGQDDWGRSAIAGGPTPLDVEARRAPFADRQLDRENAMAMVERQLAAQQAAREEQLAEARRQHEERMQQQTQQFELSRTDATSRDAEAARRHALMMESTKAEREAAAAEAAARERQWQTQFGMEQGKIDLALQQQEQARVRAEREQLIASYEASYGPGVRAIIAGDMDTPEAQDALERMAARADQSWTGFYNSDAARLDAILSRLGVVKPEARRELVDKYGLGPMSAVGPGGRSGPVSAFFNWMSGPPAYVP